MGVVTDNKTVVRLAVWAENTKTPPSATIRIDMGFFDDRSHILDSQPLEPGVKMRGDKDLGSSFPDQMKWVLHGRLRHPIDLPAYQL